MSEFWLSATGCAEVRGEHRGRRNRRAPGRAARCRGCAGSRGPPVFGDRSLGQRAAGHRWSAGSAVAPGFGTLAPISSALFRLNGKWRPESVCSASSAQRARGRRPVGPFSGRSRWTSQPLCCQRARAVFDPSAWTFPPLGVMAPACRRDHEIPASGNVRVSQTASARGSRGRVGRSPQPLQRGPCAPTIPAVFSPKRSQERRSAHLFGYQEQATSLGQAT